MVSTLYSDFKCKIGPLRDCYTIINCSVVNLFFACA